MVLSLIDACLKVGIDRESFLAAVPAEIAASIPTGDTQSKQLIHAWFHLNKMSCPPGRPHPMSAALDVCCYLAEPYGLMDTFRVAQAAFAEPATLEDSKDRTFYALFTRRMKETYLDFGCRVMPSIDEPPGPFMVEHPDRRTSFVAVFYDGGNKGPPLGSLIAIVQQWLHTARSSGEDAEGYIVLAPSARKADREQVLQAQLRAIDYSERRSVRFDTIETIIRCVLGEAPPASEAGFSIVQGGEARPAEDALAAFLRDSRTHAWLLVQPRDADAESFPLQLFHVAARSFLRHGPPAPLPLGMDWRTRGVTECAGDVFSHHGVPISSIVLERVLREGVICPILAHDVPEPPPSTLDPLPTPRLLEGMSEQSKLLVVFSPGNGAAAREVRNSLHSAGYGARIVRALMNEP
ncbi:hypothetical protein WME98_08000 [Sorangium sp. So ce296]|uniref:hypothetical protein n=1 Tax=Sorangium sp. So ce296 TaxID=3133296 RepID=UPI003F5E7B68